jgi:Family of unknown function (DUF6152)
MSRFSATLAAIVLAFCSASVAHAHHSAAMFDFTKSGELEGVVKDIRVINPHMSLTLVVTDSKGTREVSFEGHSVNNFYRAGWRPHSVKVGDKIKVRFAPRKDGHDGGFVSAFTTAQGQEIGFRLPGASAPASGTKAP